VPVPTLTAFVADVRAGRVADVLVTVSPHSPNPVLAWVTAHCAAQRGATGAWSSLGGATTRLYRCRPAHAVVTTATSGGGSTRP